MATAAGPVPGRERPAFDTPNILWFFGAFTAAGACEVIISRVHPSARGFWILLASLAFMGGFAVLSAVLLRAGWWVPGGVLAAMAVTFVAPAAGGFERLIGVWPGSPGLDFFQEFEGAALAVALVVAVAGLVAFALVGFPFILAIVAVTTFVAAQLLVPAFVSKPGLGDHATAFIVVGGGLIVLGLALDLLSSRPTAFWWHLVGLAALAVGLGYHASQNATWGWVMILVFGAAVLFLATVLVRGTFAVFGIAGVYAGVAHYLEDWFGSLGTAFALAAFGLGLVALGIGARRSGGTWPTLARRSPAA